MTIEVTWGWKNSRRNDARQRAIVESSTEYVKNVYKKTDAETLEEILIANYPRAAHILYELGESGIYNLGFRSGEVNTLAIAIKNNSYPFTVELAGEIVEFDTIDLIGAYLEQRFAKKPGGRKSKE